MKKKKYILFLKLITWTDSKNKEKEEIKYSEEYRAIIIDRFLNHKINELFHAT